MEATKPAGGSERGRAKQLRGVVLAFRLCVAVGFIAASALGREAWGWPGTLDVALAVMGCFVALETGVFFFWARGAFEHATEQPDRSSTDNPYADAARVAITTQGIVLGLVTFKQGSLSDITVKVGACALVAGVLSALVLYLNVVQGPPSDVNRRFATSINFSFVMWALAFGLICVVAGSWA
jgi:hypothetical protein